MADAKNQKSLIIIPNESELEKTTSKPSHGGTQITIATIYDEIRVPSQAIRDLINDNTGVIHEIYGKNIKRGEEGLFEFDVINKMIESIPDFRVITIREVKIWLAIVFRQGYESEASFKSIYDIAKSAGMDRHTDKVKSDIQTLSNKIIYTANTRKRRNKPKWTKTQFIESIGKNINNNHKIINLYESDAKTTQYKFINLFHATEQSFLKFNYKSWMQYLEFFNTKQQYIAYKIFMLVLIRINEKSKFVKRWMTHHELQSKVFFLMMLYRNDYRPLLKKCLDTLKQLKIIKGYEDDNVRILLHTCISPNKRKSSPNKRKSSPNKRKSSPNKRNPPQNNIEFID